MDRLEDLLRRIRDPRECTELLLDAPRAGTRGVARQVAAVLSSLPAVHRELAAHLTAEQHSGMPAVAELVRRVGALELLLLSLAEQQTKETRHGFLGRGPRGRRQNRTRGFPDVGRLALP
jgi:hypothetical protein